MSTILTIRTTEGIYQTATDTCLTPSPFPSSIHTGEFRLSYICQTQNECQDATNQTEITLSLPTKQKTSPLHLAAGHRFLVQVQVLKLCVNMCKNICIILYIQSGNQEIIFSYV